MVAQQFHQVCCDLWLLHRPLCPGVSSHTEIECLWQACLTGGDGILLNGEETRGFWSPGVVLNSDPKQPDHPHSVTCWVAYWAGGVDVLERGEPL